MDLNLYFFSKIIESKKLFDEATIRMNIIFKFQIYIKLDKFENWI